jgi:hypothetical protein
MKEAQQLLAAASQHVFLDVQQQFSGVAPVMQQMLQQVQQMRQSQQPTDPSVQALVSTQMAETQRKSQYDQGRLQLDKAKLDAQVVDSREDNESAQAIEAAKITNSVTMLNLQQRHEVEKQQLAQQQAEQLAQQQAQQQNPVMPQQQPAPQEQPQGVGNE